jgi:pyridoxine 5-phosphate synthase
MTKLSVNLNAVAMLRNRRDIGWPSVTGIAKVVLDAGAVGITVHPRPDERHIRRGDVFALAELLKADYPDAEFNIEGYPSDEFLELIERVKPTQVTFVPDDPGQATSDHGWDVYGNEELLRRAIGRGKAVGARVALFIDADPGVPPKAARVGADRVELYTGPYGAKFKLAEGPQCLEDLAATAKAAHEAGLGVNAGHDLTLENLPAFVAKVQPVDEVSIGHGITSDALLMGFNAAVRRYIEALVPAKQ